MRIALDTHRAPRRLSGWVWLCVVAVLGFQSLGLVHRALHGGGSAPVPMRLSLGAAELVAHLASSGQALIAADEPGIGEQTKAGAAFGHAAGSLDCQLLDQLAQALGPVAQALAWTALLPDHPVAQPQPHSAVVARLWRLPARAPPLG